MPARLLPVICADYQTTLEAKARAARALSDAVDRYRHGDVAQIHELARHLEALRELHESSTEILFVADAALTALLTHHEGLAPER